MKKIFSLLSITTFLSACSPIDSMRPFDAEQARIWIESTFVSKPAQQRIVLDLPKRQIWKKVPAALDAFGSTIKLIPVYATPTTWQESIQTNVVGYLGNPHFTAKQFALDNFQQVRAHCQQATPVMLADNQHFVIYRITMSHCDNAPAQQQIVKAFNGSDGVYAVRYVAITGNVPTEQIRKMTNVIFAAEFQNNPEYR